MGKVGVLLRKSHRISLVSFSVAVGSGVYGLRSVGYLFWKGTYVQVRILRAGRLDARISGRGEADEGVVHQLRRRRV